MSELFGNRYDDCRECYGHGTTERTHWEDRGRTVTVRCEACFGTGRRVSEIGRELIEFLDKFYDIKPTAKAEDR